MGGSRRGGAATWEAAWAGRSVVNGAAWRGGGEAHRERVEVLEALVIEVDEGERPVVAAAVDGEEEEVLREDVHLGGVMGSCARHCAKQALGRCG